VSREIPVISLNASANPSTFSQAITFTVSVAATVGMPTGNITFREGATTLGTATLDSSGHATFSTSALSAGTHNITADYSGDSVFGPSTSAPLAESVDQAPTAAAVTTSPNPSKFGQPIVLTATVTVSASATGTPTGSVTFLDGSTALGSGIVDS